MHAYIHLYETGQHPLDGSDTTQMIACPFSLSKPACFRGVVDLYPEMQASQARLLLRFVASERFSECIFRLGSACTPPVDQKVEELKVKVSITCMSSSCA